jgi:hypothetical protein
VSIPSGSRFLYCLFFSLMLSFCRVWCKNFSPLAMSVSGS